MAKLKSIKSENIIKINSLDILGHQQKNIIGYMQIFNRLLNIPDTSEDYKYSYWVNRNIDRFKSIIKPIEQDVQKKMESINKDDSKAYNENIALLKEVHAEKDENGKMIVVEGKINIIDKDKFEEELKKVDELYPELLNSIKEFNEYVYAKELEEFEFEPYMLEKKNLPKGLTPNELEMLNKFLS